MCRNYARLAAPLHQLVGELAGRGGKRCKKDISIVNRWTDAHTSAFNELKTRLTSSPVLGYADFRLPFFVETDASHQGLGAILVQVQDGKHRVIAYASHSLSKGEKNPQNYSSKKLELLALKWAIIDKFREYLEHSSFTLYTDNNPLAHSLTTKKLPALKQRWVSALTGFDFKIQFRPGRCNGGAVALSRMDHPEQSDDSEVDDSPYTDAADLLARVPTTGVTVPDEVLLAACEQQEDDGDETVFISAMTAMPFLTLSSTGMSDLQKKDPAIGRLKQLLSSGVKPSIRPSLL